MPTLINACADGENLSRSNLATVPLSKVGADQYQSDLIVDRSDENGE